MTLAKIELVGGIGVIFLPKIIQLALIESALADRRVKTL
jgi:hypothetical protein